ncbi:MAG: VWA domain-containing protein [Planctomycetes bacterium]|nr:VWA domain-containing protein [Planctomycetota bacterium]
MRAGPVEFAEPAWLLLLLLALPAVALWRASLMPLPHWRAWGSLGLRLALLAGLAAAMASPRLVRTSDRLCVLFVLDWSDSMRPRGREAGLAWVQEALKGLGERDRAGLIVFGEDAYVEWPPTEQPLPGEPETVLATSFTDISRALRLATATFPEDAVRRAVLVSDGNENLGDAIREAMALQAGDVVLDTHLVTEGRGSATEVLVERVQVPPRSARGEPVGVRVVVEATSAGEGHLRIVRSGDPPRVVADQAIAYREGQSVWRVLDDPPGEDAGSLVTYEVVLSSPQDDNPNNNRSYAFTRVSGEPRVLAVFQRDALERSGGRPPLVEALRRAGLAVDLKDPSGLPLSLDELDRYRAFFLVDVPARLWTEPQMEATRRFVHDRGGGLVMVGGPDSFAVGGYDRTPVEEALPVEMDIRHEKKMPSLAYVVAVDKSGSMGSDTRGTEKIAIAREAAAEVASTLSPWDRFGAIGFDSASKWVVPMQNVTDVGAVMDQLRSLRAGGGTNIYPALEDAYAALQAEEAVLKHVIVMTDGETVEGPYETLVGRMHADGITVTTVAVGEQADQGFLQDMARWGEGEFFWTPDVSFVPRIFAQDVFLSYRKFIEEPEGGLVPVPGRPHEVTDGVAPDGWPRLGGFVQTMARPRAEVLLRSPAESVEPLLAVWRYGLGKAAAFTSDTERRWAAEWLSWPGYDRLWTRLARWVLRDEGELRYPTALSFDGGEGVVTVDALDEAGAYENLLSLEAVVSRPDGRPERLPLEQTGPGRYQGRFRATAAGTYAVYVVAAGDPEAAPVGSATGARSYPPEYRVLEPNPYLLARVAELAGGRSLAHPGEAFRRDGRTTTSRREAWMPLAALAAFLLLLDVAARRVVMPEALSRAMERQRGRRAAPVSSPVLGRLREAKERLRGEATATPATTVTPAFPPTPTPTPAPTPAPTEPAPTEPAPTEPAPDDESTTARLLRAKHRARDGGTRPPRAGA